MNTSTSGTRPIRKRPRHPIIGSSCHAANPASKQVTLRQDADHVVGVQVNRVGIRRHTIPAAPAHDVPGAGSEEVLPRHRGEGRLDLRISDAGAP